MDDRRRLRASRRSKGPVPCLTAPTHAPLHPRAYEAKEKHGIGLVSKDFTRLTANLDAAFLLTKAVARGLARQKTGRIIYISSDAGLLGDLMRAAYSASKAGLLGLCKTAAREFAASRVTVNAVAPGLIATDMTADMPEARRAKQLAAIPLGRFGSPEEVAGVVRFLASDDAAWITGQTLCVDGGLRMRD